MEAFREFNICYYSSTGLELSSLSEGILRYRHQGGKVEITARTQAQLSDASRRKAFVSHALKSDIVILFLHGGKSSCPVFEPLVEALEEVEQGRRPWLHIQPTSGDEDSVAAARDHSDGFGTPRWDRLKQYLERGGCINFERLLFYLHNVLFETALDCQEPFVQRNEGIYHPDYSAPPERERYLAEKVDPDRLTVGIWFYQTYWVNNNLAFVDQLIRSIEAHGANVIPVFHFRYKDKARGNKGAEYIVRHFFMDGSKPRIDVLISPMLFSLALASPDYGSLLPELGVVCIQAMVSMGSYASWKESVQGIGTMEVSFNAAQPEFDGNLITVPVATREQEIIDPITGGLLNKYEAIGERTEKVVRLALNWARLRRIPNSERKVAVIFHHYPPRNDRIGCAAGLDSFASVKLILERMQKDGYHVETTFDDAQALAEEMLSRMTADQRWITPDKMAERAEAKAGKKWYQSWHEELPEKIRDKMTQDWGQMPGELFVHDDELLFAGLQDGNIFISIQPPRGILENIEQSCHDLYLTPPHHYLAQYRWIRDVFKADAVIHVGKHGTLEWLPGKALGLSGECFPDLAVMELPNIYPYIINDPSEGTQAKRRSYACIIDHLTPVYTNADLYDQLSKVENLLNDYAVSVSEDPAKIEVLRPMIWKEVEAADLDRDLETDEQAALADFDGFLEKLHSYLQELGDTMINDGLHTFSIAPEGGRLIEFLAQITRVDNGGVPSLRESVLAAMGHDLDDLLANRGKRLARYDNLTGGQVIDLAHKKVLQLIGELEQNGFEAGKTDELINNVLQCSGEKIKQGLDWVAQTLVPSVQQTTEEMNATMDALAGQFVRPGPSGSPTRGQAEILPTGRNFYSVDPNKIPSPAAWEVGKRLGDSLLEAYLEEKGRYPDSIGILVYGGTTMRTRGDDIAEIYYLMGVKPVWHPASGNVIGLEVIPGVELGRPRLDVVPRVSGFFRDGFPNLMERIDEAVAMVAALKESPKSNILRRNVLADMKILKQQGMSEEEAGREATFRVFSCPPGTYGAGVSELVESRNWESSDDLGNRYIRYSAHAYARGTYGAQKTKTFRRLLSRMDVTVKNEDSREYDMMSCTDYYNYYGGLICAAKTVRGTLPVAYMGDSSDPKRVRMRTTFAEARHVLRSRLINPKWISGMRRHGYKGAGDISQVMDIVLGWDATGEVIEDWMYAKIASVYALEPEMREWLKDVNPYALQNILDKLLEASHRGMWNADETMEQELKELYLEMEGEIEERTE